MCELYEPNDYCDVWDWVEVRSARKQHVCSGCGGRIPVGAKYWRLRMLCEGEWSGEKGCAPCVEDSAVFGDAHGGMGFSPSGFVRALRDCVSEDDPEDAKWLPMLDRVTARRAEAEGVGR